MSVCDLCNQEMIDAESCTVRVLHTGGRPTAAIPHPPRRRRGAIRGGRCGDCGVNPGGFHHLGCDLQECPRCLGQLISCGCRWDELPEPDEDDEPEDWDEDPLPPSATTPVPRRRNPLGAVAAPLRARHQPAVRAVAAWALAAGRPCNLDVVALCFESLQQHHGAGRFRLDRPTVNGLLWTNLHNVPALLDTTLPDEWPVDLWTVLGWCHDTGQLTVDSDPLGPLREPLSCYGGLGADGLPRPAGTDVDFPCQCYLPHDPTCPPHLFNHIVGRDHQSNQPFVARIRLRLRSDPVTAADREPLHRLVPRVHAGTSCWDTPIDVHVDHLNLVGRIDASRSTPELRVYACADSWLGYNDLVLDADGGAWSPIPDRRHRTAFRWKAVSAIHGALSAGIVGVAPPEADSAPRPDLRLAGVQDRIWRGHPVDGR